MTPRINESSIIRLNSSGQKMHLTEASLKLLRKLLDDQSGQYWIYANTDNELATVDIKVYCE